MKINLLFWALAAVLAVGAAQAVTLSNTTLNATTSNTTVTFSVSVNADLAVVNSSYVALYNVTYSNAFCSVTSALLNFSTPNSTTDSSSFPHCTSATTISNAANVSTNITVSISTGGVTPVSPYIVYSNGTTTNITSYTFSGGVITFTVPISGGGLFNLFFDGSPGTIAIENTCTGVENSFSGAAAMMALVIMVIFGGFAVITVYDFKNKSLSFDGKELIQLTIGFLVTCILIIVSAGIIGVATGGC